MSGDGPTCVICDRPILPGEPFEQVSQDWMHLGCLPSTRRQARIESGGREPRLPSAA